MDVNQLLIPYLPAILTIVAIVLGSVFNNRRIDDLKDLFKAEFGRLEGVLTARLMRVEDRLVDVEKRMDRLETRMERLEGRVDAVEQRLTRLEEHRILR